MGLSKAGAIAGVKFGVLKVLIRDGARIGDESKDGARLAIVVISLGPFFGSGETYPYRAVKKGLNASSRRSNLMRLEDVEVAGANQGEWIENSRGDRCRSERGYAGVEAKGVAQLREFVRQLVGETKH